MAVPPEGAKVVLQAVLKTFAGIDYDWVKPTEKLQLRNLLNTDGSSLKGIDK